jgi:hypothetical protein
LNIWYHILGERQDEYMRTILFLLILIFILMLVNIWGSNSAEKRVAPLHEIEVFVETDKRGVLQ